MKQELQDQIFSKYPEFFKEKDLPCSQTCMCWGLEIGDGWYCIINELCFKIEQYFRKNPDLRSQFAFTQVKEKFGTLRVYYHGGDDTIDSYVDKAEQDSAITCETCGKIGKLNKQQGWLYTSCEEHKR